MVQCSGNNEIISKYNGLSLNGPSVSPEVIYLDPLVLKKAYALSATLIPIHKLLKIRMLIAANITS